MLVDEGGATYDNRTYKNVKVTPSTVEGKQVWTPASDILLSSTTGTLYGYYPYNSSVTDFTQVPVAADDTDYMYATPVGKIDDGNYHAAVTMKHALAAIRLNIVKGTYTGTGAVSSVSVSGDNIATSGKLNAKTGALTSLSGTGSAVTNSTAFTLSTTAKQIDCIIVPVTNTSNTPTITMTIDGKEYIATPAAISLEQGTIYEYTLTINAKDISLSDVKVGDWGYNDSGNPVIHAGYNITLVGDIEGIAFSNTVNDDGSVTILALPVKENGKVNEVTCSSNATCTQTEEDNGMRTIVLNNIQGDVTVTFNGVKVTVVYAVSSTGALIDVANADESCIAVALVVGEHKFWIEKNETKNTETYKAAYNEFGATNTGYTYLYWGGYGTDQTGIPTYNKADASNSYGYLPRANGSYNSTPNLSGDYTTWTSGALSDFNGKANSDVIKTITTNGTSSSKSYAPMGILLNKFNDANNEENGGYTDWHIPACGQLSLMYLNMTAINNALTKIGGQTIASSYYWSSSEYSSDRGWNVGFSNGDVGYNSKNNNHRVRFVRDF